MRQVISLEGRKNNKETEETRAYDLYFQLKPVLEGMLKRHEMYVRSSEGLEDTFFIMINLIDPDFSYKELSGLKNKHNCAGNMSYAPKFNFETSPSIIDLLQEAYDVFVIKHDLI